MFLNWVLFNSEAWSSINKRHIDENETIDRTIMKFLVGGHAKTPSEIFYLETATIPLKVHKVYKKTELPPIIIVNI